MEALVIEGRQRALQCARCSVVSEVRPSLRPFLRLMASHRPTMEESDWLRQKGNKMERASEGKRRQRQKDYDCFSSMIIIELRPLPSSPVHFQSRKYDRTEGGGQNNSDSASTLVRGILVVENLYLARARRLMQFRHQFYRRLDNRESKVSLSVSFIWRPHILKNEAQY